MSDNAMRVLDERERFCITWDGGAYRVSIPRYDGGEVVTAEAYERMERLVRSVAEASCTAYLHPRGCSVGFPRAVNTYTWPNPEDWWRDHACIPCKVRRELSGGVR